MLYSGSLLLDDVALRSGVLWDLECEEESVRPAVDPFLSNLALASSLRFSAPAAKMSLRSLGWAGAWACSGVLWD